LAINIFVDNRIQVCGYESCVN